MRKVNAVWFTFAHIRPGISVIASHDGGAQHANALLTGRLLGQLAGLDIASIHPLVDFINLWTFDYHGPWEGVVDYHAPWVAVPVSLWA